MEINRSDVRFRLFCGYINELQIIKGLPALTLEQLDELHKGYLAEPALEWIDVFEDGSEGKVIGFLLIGYPPNCHPDAGFYIEEAYIAPEFRRRGYMTSAASRFISENEGTYCLFILNGNEPAKVFWPKVFGELGYEAMELCDVGAGDEYCEQYGYSKPCAKTLDGLQRYSCHKQERYST